MSVAKNYVYNVIYQIANLIIPLITVPYISRVLGAEGVGINAYTNSIVQYFILLGTIGISLYGSKSIAYIRDDRKKITNTFWSIFSLQIIMSLFAYVLYIVFISVLAKDNKIILLIQSVNILAAAIDVTWLFSGIEDFKKTVTRNLIVKTLSVISIFLFVKQRSDLWLYTFILAFSVLLGQIVLWTYVGKIVDKYVFDFNEIKKHFMPSFKLFIPQIAIQIYLVLNKSMLGWMANKTEVGLYENADKIVKMSLAVLTATGTVMLPRISNTFAKGDINKVKDYIIKSLNFVSYLSIPITFGLIGISAQFVPWFFGDEFNKCIELIIILSPILIFISLSNVIGIQYMIPTGKTNEFTLSVTSGAIVNLLLNIFLINSFYSIGAAISTLIAEIFVTVVQLFLIRNEVKISVILSDFIKYIMAALIMMISVKYLGSILGVSIRTTFIQIVLGAVIYISVLFIVKSEFNKSLFMKIIKSFSR
ncbi:flippase [Clostridium sp. YIM B02515]|uniref:Flippase n=1 Tax=Clostridium rhizosphaerae TaxID=2803861 RepID=A0ABS1TAH7_9CLOT|nr:flippase [Clostridium rhizosphaerae]MBL4936347.1 flippase [Clostridium rhizosphaerae]